MVFPSPKRRQGARVDLYSAREGERPDRRQFGAASDETNPITITARYRGQSAIRRARDDVRLGIPASVERSRQPAGREPGPSLSSEVSTDSEDSAEASLTSASELRIDDHPRARHSETRVLSASPIMRRAVFDSPCAPQSVHLSDFLDRLPFGFDIQGSPSGIPSTRVAVVVVRQIVQRGVSGW